MLVDATSRVPGGKWVFGPVAMGVGAAAILGLFLGSGRLAFFASTLAFALTIVFYVFARGTARAKDLAKPFRLLIWFTTLLFVILILTLYLCVFWGKPLDLRHWISVPTVASDAAVIREIDAGIAVADAAASPPAEKADVFLVLGAADVPVFWLYNVSRTSAERPEYQLTLYDLSQTNGQEGRPLYLATPVDMLPDYILPENAKGPWILYWRASNKELVKAGDRIFGHGSVQCANCSGVRYYWIYAVVGKDGWIQPIDISEVGTIEGLESQILDAGKTVDISKFIRARFRQTPAKHDRMTGWRPQPVQMGTPVDAGSHPLNDAVSQFDFRCSYSGPNNIPFLETLRANDVASAKSTCDKHCIERSDLNNNCRLEPQ
jgi:hypothetical protein